MTNEIKFKREAAGFYTAFIGGEKVYIEKRESESYGDNWWHISSDLTFSDWNDFDPYQTLKGAKKGVERFLAYQGIERKVR